MSAITIVFEVALFMILVIGFTIYIRNKKELSSRLFLYLSIAIAIWVFTNLMVYSGVGAIDILTWYRWTYVTAVPMILSIFIFSLYFPRSLSRNNEYLVLLAFLLSIPALVTSLSSRMITGADIENGGFTFTFGGTYYVFLAFAAIFIIGSILVFTAQFVRSKGTEKQQVKYVLAGFAVGSLYALFVELLLPLMGVKALVNTGSIGAIMLSVAIGYAMTRYQLFNVKVLLTEATVFLVLVVTLVQTFTAQGQQLFTRILLFAAFAVGGLVLIRSVRDEVKRREEVEELAKEKTKALAELEQRNKNLATLQKISRLVLDEIELKPMAQKILDEIPRELENCRGALLNLVKGGQLGAYAISSTDIRLSRTITDDPIVPLRTELVIRPAAGICRPPL